MKTRKKLAGNFGNSPIKEFNLENVGAEGSIKLKCTTITNNVTEVNTVEAQDAVALGRGNTIGITPAGAFVSGHKNTISNDAYDSGTFGYFNTVKGQNALTAGQNNQNNQSNTIIVGRNNEARTHSGYDNNAIFGEDNLIDDADNTMLAGLGLKNSGNNQFIIGKYNIGKSGSLFEIGNGSKNNNVITRGNVFDVNTSGTFNFNSACEFTTSNDNWKSNLVSSNSNSYGNQTLIASSDGCTIGVSGAEKNGRQAIIASKTCSSDANDVAVIAARNSNIYNQPGGHSTESIILGGYRNTLKEKRAAIISGNENTIDYTLIDSSIRYTDAFYATIIGGQGNIAGHRNSAIIGGHGLITSSTEQVVIGRYNTLSSPDSLFVVGKGSTGSNRSNAFEVTNTGIVRAYGAPVGNNDVIRLLEFGSLRSEYYSKHSTHYGPIDENNRILIYSSNLDSSGFALVVAMVKCNVSGHTEFGPAICFGIEISTPGLTSKVSAIMPDGTTQDFTCTITSSGNNINIAGPSSFISGVGFSYQLVSAGVIAF